MNHKKILRRGPHKRLKTRAGKHMDRQKYEGNAYETAGRLHFFIISSCAASPDINNYKRKFVTITPPIRIHSNTNTSTFPLHEPNPGDRGFDSRQIQTQKSQTNTEITQELADLIKSL